MLSVENLSFSYARKAQPVLSDFDMRLSQPGIYGLLGPNGAGKSTLLYLIMGALSPATGTVLLDGVATRLRRPATLASMMLVPEEISFPGMSLESYIRVYAPLYPNFSREVFDDCLAEFLMEAPHNLQALSMGQKKKVYISFALAARTPLLLMDEPTNGLDIQAKAAFRRLVSRHIPESQIVIISTHQVRDLEMLLDHILIMNQRQLIFNHAVSDIQDHLVFERNVAPELCTGALAYLPSPGGFDIIRTNTDGAITEVNLEILFDLAMRQPDTLTNIFNAKTPEAL